MSTDRLIGRGERAPDFALPRGGQGPTRFYGLVGGAASVLVFSGRRSPAQGPTGGPSPEPAGMAPGEIAARLAATTDPPLDVHLVLRGEGTRHADTEGAFLDPEGHVHAAYGVGDEDGPVAVVLDPAVRVIDINRLHATDDPVAAVTASLPATPPDLGLAPRLAPVMFVPDALSPQWCERLMERWATDGAVETGVETIVEGARAEATDVRRKRRRDLTVTDPTLLRELTQHIGRRLMPELEKAFAFQAGGFEGFKVGCYDAQDRGFFEAHRDNLSAGTAHRRFGLTLNLNDDYEGGQLRFPEYGPTRYRPAPGEALVFSGSHLHEVLPVESGRRFVLLSFVLARGSRPA